MMSKKILILLCTLLLFVSLSSFAFADNYSLYGSLTPTSTQVNLLRSFYEQSPYYVPSAHYCYLRSGQFAYKLLIQRDTDYVCFTLSSNNSGYLPITTTFVNDVNITNNGFTVVADVDFDSTFFQRDTALDLLNYQQIVTLILVLGTVLFVFYLFKCKVNWFNRGC